MTSRALVLKVLGIRHPFFNVPMGKRRNRSTKSADFGADDSDSSVGSMKSSNRSNDGSIEMIKVASRLSQISSPDLSDQISVIIDGLMDKLPKHYILT